MAILRTPTSGTSKSVEYPTPSWFRNDKPVDVSIIVPLYKSRKVVTDLIHSFPNFEGKYSWEVIFVDDHCPENTKDIIAKTWEGKLKRPVGKIFFNGENKGYGLSCNIGAEHALGTYLVFLNADTRVTPNWLDPMIDLLKGDPEIGIVGNLQLKDGGVWNGTIDSAGSEWIWEGETFSHIGRHTYHRQNLPVPMRPENAPSEILQVAEREMVTGCCQAIPTSLFREIGGYNPNYRIGYWEDSELCMTVKELGYKIMFQPNSLIFHKLGHTGSGGHKFQSHNRDYFFNKWVNSGRIDKLVGSPRPRSFHINTVYLKRTGANGDVLVAAAVASALKEKYNCQIIFCTGCPDVLKGNPHINKIIQDQNIKAREHQIFYDLDMVYEYRPYTNILDAYAQAVGVSKEKCKLHLSISRPKVQLPNDYVVIHPGRTMWAGRDWKQENFAEIAKRLTDQGLQVVLVGNGDYPIVNAMDLRNQTTIAELAYTIKNSKLFIGIDSFPMHVAQTFDVPGVCFFGSVNPDTRILSTKMHGITAKSLPCLGCHHRKPTPCTVTNICQIGHQDCIDQVTVDDMYQKINEILVNI